MARFILLFLVGVLAYFLLRGLFKAQRKDAPPPAATPLGEDMVTCARCGVNLPRSESIEQGGLLVCRENPACKPPA